jgi:hypothetical protein
MYEKNYVKIMLSFNQSSCPSRWLFCMFITFMNKINSKSFPYIIFNLFQCNFNSESIKSFNYCKNDIKIVIFYVQALKNNNHFFIWHKIENYKIYIHKIRYIQEKQYNVMLVYILYFDVNIIICMYIGVEGGGWKGGV